MGDKFPETKLAICVKQSFYRDSDPRDRAEILPFKLLRTTLMAAWCLFVIELDI